MGCNCYCTGTCKHMHCWWSDFQSWLYCTCNHTDILQVQALLVVRLLVLAVCTFTCNHTVTLQSKHFWWSDFQSWAVAPTVGGRLNWAVVLLYRYMHCWWSVSVLARPCPIMLKMLPIRLFSNAHVFTY